MFFREIYLFLTFFLLSWPAVQSGGTVTYSTSRVCGLKGASVILPCTYEYSWIGHYTGGEWYEDQSGRVREHSNSNYPDCSLKIHKLSHDHSGVYHFRFYTALHRSWITSKPGVTVSVTDLSVEEDPDAGNQNQTKVTCSTSCSLGPHLHYVWYKNGRPLQDKTTASLILDSTSPSEKGSYSCAMRGYPVRSPAVCVPEKQCWGVTYTYKTICALVGSSVDIPCTYKYPRDQSIKTTFWLSNCKSNKESRDQSLEREYLNHMDYLGNKKNNCTLRFKAMRESHSGEYGFRFKTEQGRYYSGLPGVNVSVTALQLLPPLEAVVKEGENVTLTCNTTCILSNDPTYVWNKDGQPVAYTHTTRDNKLHLNPVSSEDAGSYSCAVRGHESLSSPAVFINVFYMPKNTSVSLRPSGEIMAGGTVTLTCSSDANPPVYKYTWYMKTGAESVVMGTGESISFNVTSDTSGLYYCKAQNEVGSQTSAEACILTEGELLPLTMGITSGITIFIILAVLLVLGLVWLRKKQGAMTVGIRIPNANMQNDSDPVSSTLSAGTVTFDPRQSVASHVQDDITYADIWFVRSKNVPASVAVLSKSSPTSAEEDYVIYSVVNKPRRT